MTEIILSFLLDILIFCIFDFEDDKKRFSWRKLGGFICFWATLTALAIAYSEESISSWGYVWLFGGITVGLYGWPFIKKANKKELPE